MDQLDRACAQRLPFLAALRGEEADRVLAGARFEDAPGGTLLFNEGEPARFVHLLLKGVVEISRVTGERDCGVMMFTSGDIFMPAAALFDEPYLVTARALCPCRLLLLRSDALRAEAETNPALAMRLCQLISGQWRMAVRNILDLKCRSAPQRLGAFLLRLAEESPSANGAELPVAKRHLASRLGMSAATLSRTLQVLAENGLHVRGKRIIVNDREAIERFCGPDPYPDGAEVALGVYTL